MPKIPEIVDSFMDRQGIVIVDGGLATELEFRGYDLSDSLWSARLLLDEPQAIKQVHADYLTAGADIVIAATYQASIPGFMARGLSSAESADVLRSAVRLAIEARDEFWTIEANRSGRLPPLVAAGVGPYGAYLANGAEYTGDYGLSVEELILWHRSRWHILAESSADMLACESCPSFNELKAYCLLLLETPRTPAWVSFTARDGTHISDGTPIVDCVTLLDRVSNVFAVGVNCIGPSIVPELIGAVRSKTSKHIIVYPNSGERYDATLKGWEGESRELHFGALSREWLKMGAVMIGGCCRTRPFHIRQIREWISTK